MEGVIKRVDLDKRFGFIESNGQDYFFHCYNLDNKRDEPHLRQGMLVQFSEAMGKKGPRADDIKLLGESRIAHDPFSETFRTFKSKPTTRVDSHETSSWKISASHAHQKSARQLLIDRSHYLGANGVSHFCCERKLVRGKTIYVLSGIPVKVSQPGVKLKKATHLIDDIAFRVKRNSCIRFVLSLLLVASGSYFLSHYIGTFGWISLSILPVFWNDRAWLTKRKTKQ